MTNNEDDFLSMTEQDNENTVVAAVVERSVTNIRWTYLQTILARIVQPITAILLARYLFPEDYALLAIASTVLSFVDLFKDLGLSQAYIQKDESECDRSLIDQIFWVGVLISFVFYIVLFISSPLIARYFNRTDASLILRVYGLLIIVKSFGNVPLTLLIKDMEFGKLLWVNGLPNLLPIVITLPLAAQGIGAWSLIIGSMSASVLSVGLAWVFYPYRPNLSVSFKEIKPLLTFGLWVVLEMLMGWFYVSGDDVFVGHFLSSNEFGLYTQGYKMAVMIIATVLTPVSTMSYVAFSKLHNHRGALGIQLIKAMKLSAFFSLPIGVGLFLVAEPAVKVFFGSNWIGLETPLGLLAIVQGISHIVLATPAAIRALGRPDLLPKFQAVKLIYTLPAYYFGAQLGLRIFCYTKIVVVVIGVVLWIGLASYVFSIPLKKWFSTFSVPILATLIMLIVLIGSKIAFSFIGVESNILILFSTIGLGSASYCMVTYILDRSMFFWIVRLVKRSVFIKNPSEFSEV